MIVELARGPLVTKHGEWDHVLYWDGMQQAIALVFGTVTGATELPVRVHSACITAHVFLSTECDCREQLEISMVYIREQGSGVIIWLDHEGRANGMMAHTATQQLKRDGMSQAEAYKRLGYPSDARSYRTATQILAVLGVESIVLITNNPNKVKALRDAGLPIVMGDKRAMIKPDNIILERQYRDKIAEGHMIPGTPNNRSEKHD